MLSKGPQLGLVLWLALAPLFATQAPRRPAPEPPAAITRVRVLLSAQGPPALEITATRPVTPRVQKAENPPRFVMDLPNTVMSVRSKKIDVNNDTVKDVRLDQFQDRPPVVRIIVDLAKPAEYSSTTAGNVLTLKVNQPAVANQAPPPSTPAPSVPAFTQGVEPAVVPVSPGSNGAIVMAGSRIANGASVSAGADTAVLKLTRGGEMLLCPRTSVSVTQSKNGRDMLVGMSTGALETHFTSAQDRDAILTPDFRILLAGPGSFHYAISTDSRGNTCVRGLPGNTAPIIVSELMGDGSYTVKPTEEIVFRGGKLSDPDGNIPTNCGCPAPAVPAMRASDNAPEVPESQMPANMRLARPEDEGKEINLPPPNAGPQGNSVPASQVTMSVAPDSAPVPASGPHDVHVRVEAPMVFRASDLPTAAPAPVAEAAQLSDPRTPPPAPTVTPVPPPKAQKEHRGFFGKIKGWFSSH